MPASSEIRHVTAQVHAPNAATGYPGKIVFGHYRVANGVVTLTDEDGRTLRHEKTGEPYTHRLRPGDDHAVMARVLTLRAKKRPGDDFNRPLHYPRLGLA